MYIVIYSYKLIIYTFESHTKAKKAEQVSLSRFRGEEIEA